MADRAAGLVDPEQGFQLEEEDQENKDDSEPIQVIQPQAEEPRETLVEVEDYEPVASRTRSQTEPVAARTRESLQSDPCS